MEYQNKFLSYTDEPVRSLEGRMTTELSPMDGPIDQVKIGLFNHFYRIQSILLLLHILKYEIVIDGTALKWFKSLLVGGSKTVKIGDEYSRV